LKRFGTTENILKRCFLSMHLGGEPDPGLGEQFSCLYFYRYMS